MGITGTTAKVLPLTREWIEIADNSCHAFMPLVLPLTREWIEIDKAKESTSAMDCSPSYEGVD